MARGHFYLNLWLLRGWQRLRGQPPRYVLGGACRRCGACCEAPAIRVPALLFHLARAKRVFLWWQEAVNGFEVVRPDPARRLFVFRCTHFDPVGRSCDSYASRPGMCREYPLGLLDQPSPELLPGCGYRVVARGREGWLRALEDRGLNEEQIDKLKKGLYLDP